jgi:hypothetical protein
METEGRTDRLVTLLELRNKTDSRIGAKWLLPAIASYLFWILFAISYFTGFMIPFLSLGQTLGLFGFVAFVTSTGLSFLMYGLMSRQNKHADREQEVVREVLNKVQSRTSPSQMSVLVPLSSTEQDFAGLLQKTRQHSAILWSMLVLVPYAGWVFLIIGLYLLTQSSNNHDRMERLLFEDLNRTLVAGGSQPMAITGRFPTSRNSVAYLLASFVTLGIVAMSWLYIMIIGEDAHFAYHSGLESELLKVLPAYGTWIVGPS